MLIAARADTALRGRRTSDSGSPYLLSELLCIYPEDLVWNDMNSLIYLLCQHRKSSLEPTCTYTGK